jgi:methionyl aminopeptidase
VKAFHHLRAFEPLFLQTVAMDSHVCESVGCEAVAKMQCPTCIKLKLKAAYFCSQDCFKNSWSIHKTAHKLKTDFKPEIWPGYNFTGKLRPATVTPRRTVPAHIPRPDYADHANGESYSEQRAKNSAIIVLNDEQKEGLAVACKLGREVLDEAVKAVAVGVTTEEIDRIVHEACVDRECYPSPLNYYQFPKSCCTSVNEVICHGIPDMRPLADGDILNIDVTVFHRGFHGDLNETVFVGNVAESAKKLVKVTWECLEKAIAIVKPGERYREVGNVIQKHAHAHGFSVVRSYCGHGIHELFHTAPSVPHYAKSRAMGIMKAGHAFTIEPMISEGTWKDILWPDNWTAVTQDGRLSAQFEHTLLVTDTGCDILTRRLGTDNRPYFMDQL